MYENDHDSSIENDKDQFLDNFSLSTEMFDALLRDILPKSQYFVGAQNELKPMHARKRNFSQIINTKADTHRGEHWFAFAKHNNQTIFYDPFGKTMEAFGVSKWNQMYSGRIESYRKESQAATTSSCGPWCLYFIKTLKSEEPFIRHNKIMLYDLIDEILLFNSIYKRFMRH